MKVLYFTRDYTPHDYRFLNAILENGYEVFYLRLSDEGRQLESRPIPAAVRKVDWNWGKTVFSRSDTEAIVRDLKAVWQAVQPDVVHSGPLPDAAYLTAVADLHPHVAMSWGFDLMHDIEVNLADRLTTAVALQHADWFLGDCYVERDTAVPLGLKKEHATIFPWGINPRKFTAGESTVRAELASPEDFLMLSLRSLEPNYSVETTIRAFCLAAAAEPRMKLMILADGSQLAWLQSIAAEAPQSIQQRILWLGRKPNEALIDYYRAADLYLSASITDGSSVSLLEAMACEVPVLVSAIPGNLEWVSDGETGFLFETGNVQQMADKMVWCSQHRAELNAASQAARVQIERKADWDKNKFRLTEAYENAIRVSLDRKKSTRDA